MYRPGLTKMDGTSKIGVSPCRCADNDLPPQMSHARISKREHRNNEGQGFDVSNVHNVNIINKAVKCCMYNKGHLVAPTKKKKKKKKIFGATNQKKVLDDNSEMHFFFNHGLLEHKTTTVFVTSHTN